MPGYGVPTSEEGLLDWSWAESRLVASRNYWLSTVRADGQPHLMAVWALWTGGELFFSTDGVKGANLAREPRCSIAVETAAEPVVLQGAVRVVPSGAEWDSVRAGYAEKYGDGFPDGSPLFALRPSVAFGFLEEASEFPASATRWRFKGS